MVDVAQLVEPRIVIPVVAGSSPVVHPMYVICNGPLAQLVEQLTLNQRVVGSIPTRPTNKQPAIPGSFPFQGAHHLRTQYSNSKSIVFKVPKPIRSSLNQLHLAMEPFCNAVVLCKS